MSFLWPAALLLLLLIPVGVWAYRRRERQRAARVAGSGLVGLAGPGEGTRRRGWTRGVPAALTVAGVTILVLSLARPESVVGVPRFEGTVILAFDVSGSMAATDLGPTRMEAAKTAALELVARQPASIRIGIVVFSDSGFATVAPTHERPEIEAAIARLEPERGTSIGRGILEALAIIEASGDPDTDYYRQPGAPSAPPPTPVPAGVFEAASIVLLTDGENTAAPDPFEAAAIARDQGVRIDTVGVGTTAGMDLEVEGFRIHSALDEATLQRIAELTSGTYYPAAAPDELGGIYDDVGARLVVREEPVELTALLSGLGFGMLVAGGLLSLRWFGRIP